MSKLKKLFEIESFHLSNDLVEVDCVNGERFKRIPIDRGDYEAWLRYDDRLDWTMALVEDGQLKQTDGLLNLEEYWDLTRNAIEKDLYDFIMSHHDQRKLTRSLTAVAGIENPFGVLIEHAQREDVFQTLGSILKPESQIDLDEKYQVA